MNIRIDFSNCKLSNKFYGGSEKKLGIIFEDKPYMLKFVKKNVYGDCFNDVAEYICSQYFNLLGISAQETILGTYKGSRVVACKDFIVDGYKFVPFNAVGESTVEDDKDKYRYRYKDIEKLIDKNKKLLDKEEAKIMFWKTYILDALFANPDRHGKNWGYLKKKNEYKVAPVFDNGSSLFSYFSDIEEMEYVLSDNEELLERVYDTPSSLILYDTTISDYYRVISSLEFEYCNKALKELFPKINLDDINRLIDSTDLLDVRKMFLKRIILERYNRILKYSYTRLVIDE